MRRYPHLVRHAARACLTVCLIAAAGCNAPDDGAVSRDEALQIVLDQIVGDDDSDLIVFGLEDVVGPDDVITAYAPVPQEVSDVIEIGDDSYFFYIDDDPQARFNHPTRFVVVDRDTGQVEVSDRSWWPIVNGQAPWQGDGEYFDPDNWEHSTIAPTPRRGRGAFDLSDVVAPAAMGTRRGLVINGWTPGETLQEGITADVGDMKKTFQKWNFEVTHLGPTEDAGSTDRATTETITKWINEQAMTLGEGDEVVIYVSSHGFTSDSTGNAHAGGIWESQLAMALANFDRRVHITVIVDACESGGFVDGLAGVADLTLTATDATSSAYNDVDGDDTNPDDKGGEFTSGLCFGLQQILGDAVLMAEAQASSVIDGVPLMDAVFRKAYEIGAMHDQAAKNGWSKPQIGRGDQRTRCGTGGLGDALAILVGDKDYSCQLQPVGNETDNSNGVSTATAEGEADCEYTGSGTVELDLSTLGEFGCGASNYGETTCGGSTTAEPGTYQVIVNGVTADIPLVTSAYYQYSFVFDDGNPDNSYVPDPAFPKDFWAGSDLQYSLTAEPGAPWRLGATRNSGGGLSTEPTDARVINAGNGLILLAPADEIGDARTFRITTFRHEGDWGQSGGPWTGDVVPAVGEPMLPLLP